MYEGANNSSLYKTSLAMENGCDEIRMDVKEIRWEGVVASDLK
jgi:hypothetical protein